jgi:hypothetical protein
MDHRSDGKRETGVKQAAELGVSTLVSLTGSALSSQPDTALLGWFLNGFAAIAGKAVGYGVGQTQLKLLRRAERRVEETEAERDERLEEEGLTDKKEVLEDIWASAIPVIATSETKARRDMIRELVVNTARCDDVDAVTVEAFEALRLLSLMDYLTAPLFGWLCRDLFNADLALAPAPGGEITNRCQGPYLLLPNEQNYHGVRFHIWHWGLGKLKHQSHIEFQRHNEDWLVGLTEQGEWLRRRILDPRWEAEASMDRTGSPTEEADHE